MSQKRRTAADELFLIVRTAASDHSAGARTLDSLARAVGIGKRTLERQFFIETGMTPGRWRQQRSLLEALERLARGQPIKSVAIRAGYATPSAFTAAFRKSFGTTPGKYFA